MIEKALFVLTADTTIQHSSTVDLSFVIALLSDYRCHRFPISFNANVAFQRLTAEPIPTVVLI